VAARVYQGSYNIVRKILLSRSGPKEGKGLQVAFLKMLAEFRDGGVVGFECIFSPMEFVVAGSILHYMGNLHGAPPERNFWDFVSPEDLVYDILQIYSINLDG
jgi:hypothetical protein